MDVSPSWEFKPERLKPSRTLDISVMKKGKELLSECSGNPGNLNPAEAEFAARMAANNGFEYYVHIVDGEDLHLQKYYPCAQFVWITVGTARQGTQGHDAIERVSATSSQRTSLIVMRDDADWRFIASWTDLDTARSAREMDITHPIPNYHRTPAARVSMMTGECIMTSGH
jgi:hypothetical protein